MESPASRSSPRQNRRKERTRTRILEAAEELFADGVEAATIERIAERADVGVTTIYQHFGGKDDLHRTVVARAFERHEHDMLAACESDAEPVEKLIDVIGTHVGYYLESPQLFAMIHLRRGNPHPALADDPVATAITARVTRIDTSMVAIIDAGIGNGTLRPVDSADTTRFLWGTTNGVIALAARSDRLRLTTTELRDALVQGFTIFFEGLVADPLRGPDGRLSPALRARLRNVFETARTAPT
ncbi:TetR/AcrR family transcriptional regulator [Nocardia sp. NPDC051570]|uniref:TetR/AcrR family transcriptional regulator n=1 Tax=Nocardia sp. NPDC051570 TaxID=3364324 RepID=UPI0037A9CACC